MSQPRPAPDSFASEEVRAQLDRIVNSRAFSGSDQLKRLLEVVVERTLSGQIADLKEYMLGLEVFQRASDYDPKIDPIVRVQARRLRSKLDEYYAGDGARDSLLIHIPKGAYVPAFEPRGGAESKPVQKRTWLGAAAAAGVVVVLLAAWMATRSGAAPAEFEQSVAVLPLKMFTEGGEHAHIANQAAEVLTTELARNGQLRVLSRTTASKYRDTTASLPEIARTLGVRWVVEGGVGLEGSRVYVKLRLVDSTTDRKAWADVFDCPSGELVAASATAAGRIAAAIEERSR